MAHGLDHLDRDQLVKSSLQFSVVAFEKCDSILQSGLFNSCACPLELLSRDRCRRDRAVVLRGSVDRKASPAAADLEHTITRAQVELAAHTVKLLERCLIHGGVDRAKDPARVRKRLVEPKREEVIPQIIMRANIPPASGKAIGSQPVEHRVPEAYGSCEAAIEAIGRLTVPKEDPEQACQVVAVPSPRGTPRRPKVLRRSPLCGRIENHSRVARPGDPRRSRAGLIHSLLQARSRPAKARRVLEHQSPGNSIEDAHLPNGVRVAPRRLCSSRTPPFASGLRPAEPFYRGTLARMRHDRTRLSHRRSACQ